MKRPTIGDIARKAGVSKVAVSYALNGRPGVSDETRLRIKAIAEEVGWRPSSAARALNGKQARAVGLAVCRPARTLSVEPFFMELIGGIESELAPRSVALMLQTVDSHEAEIELYGRWWG
ncbi:LacI family transcriptional regulator, partial [Streptomyces sp. A7024]